MLARDVSAPHFTEWTRILDRFESDIAVAVSGGVLEPWQPPLDAGPIPDGLAERARRVLDAQLESMTVLGKLRLDVIAHVEAVNAVPDSRSSARPLFLDVQG